MAQASITSLIISDKASIAAGSCVWPVNSCQVSLISALMKMWMWGASYLCITSSASTFTSTKVDGEAMVYSLLLVNGVYAISHCEKVIHVRLITGYTLPQNRLHIH